MGYALIRTMNHNGHFATTSNAIDVQSDVSPGLAGFTLVGSARLSAADSRDRVRPAINNTPGLDWPSTKRITVLLSPADEPKHGAHYDLPIALAILGASARIDTGRLAQVMFFGELGLDGTVRPAPLVPEMAARASVFDATTVVVPTVQVEATKKANPRLDVVAASSLDQVVKLLENHAFPTAPQEAMSR